MAPWPESVVPKQALFNDARTESMTPEGEVAGLGSSEVGETQNHETLRNVRIQQYSIDFNGIQHPQMY